jgi:hypothetical protein
MTASLDGGAPVTLASGGTISGLAVDDTSAYWVVDDQVMKLPLAGGAATTLVSGLSNPGNLAVDDRYVYWVDDSSNGSIGRVALDGGPPTTLYAGCNPWGIAVDATSVYWTCSFAGTVMRLSPK